ncbi:MAG: hypothetical protein HC888_01005 [Candidatus Competibacteraceae bacterium]|nr:hypothetical protein [Candidatus Competibacteraceae bacterium]
MIKAKPEIVPFKVGDIVALPEALYEPFEVLAVDTNAFGTLLTLMAQDSKVFEDWSSYYFAIGAS